VLAGGGGKFSAFSLIIILLSKRFSEGGKKEKEEERRGSSSLRERSFTFIVRERGKREGPLLLVFSYFCFRFSCSGVV